MSDVDPEEAARAGRLVAATWPGATITGLHALPGHSGLTLRADLDRAPDRVAIKLCPTGRQPTGRHDILRQASLLAELAARGDVPVPAVLGADSDPPPAVIFGWAEGESIEPILEPEAGPLDPGLVRSRFAACAVALAELHAVAPSGLTAAKGEKVWLPAEELKRWRPTMATVDPDLSAGADELAAALGRHVPDPVEPTLVHGDYRLGNVLCRTSVVTAIVDWEIWSVGDPRVDLGWFFIMTAPEEMPGSATAVDGVPPASEVLAAYEEASGRPVPAMGWFDALSRYKMAAIMGNNLRRHRTGRRTDPYQERLVETIPALIRAGLDRLG